MATYQNAQITDVAVEFNKGEALCALIRSKGQIIDTDLSFILLNEADNQRLKKLMEYLKVSKFEDLKGKMFRQVLEKKQLIAFGHPLENQYVPLFTIDFLEMTEEEIEVEIAK